MTSCWDISPRPFPPQKSWTWGLPMTSASCRRFMSHSNSLRAPITRASKTRSGHLTLRTKIINCFKINDALGPRQSRRGLRRSLQPVFLLPVLLLCQEAGRPGVLRRGDVQVLGRVRQREREGFEVAVGNRLRHLPNTGHVQGGLWRLQKVNFPGIFRPSALQNISMKAHGVLGSSNLKFSCWK